MDSKKYYVHESSYVDEDVQIGEGTKVWHFVTYSAGLSSAATARWGRT